MRPFSILILVASCLASITTAGAQSLFDLFDGLPGGRPFECTPPGTADKAIWGREIGDCLVVGMTSIYLANRGNIAIDFDIRPQARAWRRLKIEPGRGDAIFCGCGSTPAFEIVVGTEQRKVQY